MKSSQLKSIYADICNGYSCFGGFYVKHLLTQDEVICDQEYEQALLDITSAGIETEEQIIEKCIESGEWSQQKENSIKSIEEDYKRLSETRYRPTSQFQLKALRAELKEIEKAWSDLMNEKSNLTYGSAERIAEKSRREKKVYLSLYKDSDLRELAFRDSFDYLDDEKVDQLTEIVFSINSIISIENMKMLALEPFFQSRLSMSDDGYKFFGKPLYLLTNYQVDLVKLGYKYKTLLGECGDLPEDYQGADGIEDWFYLKKNNALPTAEEISKHKALWD